ncbi:hypothetical protein DE146DRAFT_783649 [Phaeosphaeria sp. MPI-PUGE-AT-0046c]|nr:hypothetical protein DE146DRAFT_783649 [Phaeosphaeria sp. MPI-PUGE-AT-0046c]
MPLVGPANNVSDYSHSTVFTISIPSVVPDNVPPLTKIFTPPANCIGRWMLADNTLGTTTFVQTMPTAGATTVRVVTAETVSTPKEVGGIVRRDSMEPRQIAQAFNLTIWSIDSNPLFTSCQPYSSQALYSPGVCPDGQTVAEITQVRANKTDGGVLTSWRASCCRSGMTFGSDVGRYCISRISTPFEAHAYVTSSYPAVVNGTSTFNSTKYYEYVTSTLTGSISGRNAYSTFTVSNLTTITSALAVADPLVVAWQVDDLASFPAAYATSLANKIGVAPPLLPSARVQDVPGLPSETASGTVSTTTGISTAATAGIGVGCAVGALLIATVIIVMWFKKRRKVKHEPEDRAQIPEMEDQDVKLGKRKWFLNGNWRSEAEATGETQELDGKTLHVVAGPPAELEAHEAPGQLDNAPATGR